MKRLNGLILITISLFAASCNPDGVDELGDLYGRWKLEKVDSPTPIYYSDTLYLAFQDKVYQYQPNWDYDWGTFTRTADSLILNPLQYERFYFKEMGITLNKQRDKAPFKIDHLSRKNMQLSRHDTIWHFRKYIE